MINKQELEQVLSATRAYVDSLLATYSEQQKHLAAFEQQEMREYAGGNEIDHVVFRKFLRLAQRIIHFFAQQITEIKSEQQAHNQQFDNLQNQILDLKKKIKELEEIVVQLRDKVFPQVPEYTPIQVQLANGNYMYPDNRYAMGSTKRRTLGYIKAGIENGIEVFYITDPDDGGYLYRDTTDYGQNGDWTCNQLKFMPLNENDDRFKWYVAYKDGQQNQPRIINLAGSSKNKNNIANTDYGIHIYNWSQSWMDVPEPNVVCGKGVNNGNTELNAEIKFLEE